VIADALDTQADALEAQARTLRALAARERRSAGADGYLTIADAAALIRRSTRYVREQIRAGRLPARGAGRVVMVARVDLDAWCAAQPPRPTRAQPDGAEDAIDEADIDARVAAELARGAEARQ
jgi:excisionase family DNA binding protein